MASLESQALHQRDNAKRLKEIAENRYYQALVHNMVTDIINQVTEMILEQAKTLEQSTAINEENIIRLPHGRQLIDLNSDNGLCRHVGRVLLTYELRMALKHELASAAAYAINQGDSQNNVATAMRKTSSNLFHKHDITGEDIERLLAAYDNMDAHPDDPRYDEINVKLHDNYVFTAKRQA